MKFTPRSSARCNAASESASFWSPQEPPMAQAPKPISEQLKSDGFHGICRPSFPDGVLNVFERDYPFGWLGILTESPPPDHELIYSYTDRGFALYTMRSPTVSRLYLQWDHDEEIENWSDSRIWDELHNHL